MAVRAVSIQNSSVEESETSTTQANDHSTPDPDGLVWSAGCVDGKLILGRRTVLPEERRSILQAVMYIETFVNSPFARLDSAVDQYLRHKEQLIDAVANGSFH